MLTDLSRHRQSRAAAACARERWRTRRTRRNSRQLATDCDNFDHRRTTFPRLKNGTLVADCGDISIATGRFPRARWEIKLKGTRHVGLD
jgi:hypothetical protein